MESRTVRSPVFLAKSTASSVGNYKFWASGVKAALIRAIYGEVRNPALPTAKIIT
jgi:hypothetical protein